MEFLKTKIFCRSILSAFMAYIITYVMVLFLKSRHKVFSRLNYPVESDFLTLPSAFPSQGYLYPWGGTSIVASGGTWKD